MLTLIRRCLGKTVLLMYLAFLCFFVVVVASLAISFPTGLYN